MPELTPERREEAWQVIAEPCSPSREARVVIACARCGKPRSAIGPRESLPVRQECAVRIGQDLAADREPGLREAVEALARWLSAFDIADMPVPDSVDVPDDYELGINDAGRKLRAILAAHPSPPRAGTEGGAT